MLKMIIGLETKEQGIDRAVLLDGICTEEEFLFWMQEEEENKKKGEEISLGVMQIHAIAQRLGKSVDKYDAILGEEEVFLARRRNAIWRKIRKGKLEEAGKMIAEYRDILVNQADFGCAGIPEGEKALQRQFLALTETEIARRKALPYPEQMEIILGGLRQTIPEAAWEERDGKLWPSREWYRSRRLHSMEQFLLARFARTWECMEMGEEAFLWYQELAAYVCVTARDQADKRKLYPLLCYRMAENRLREMFGGDAWWEEKAWGTEEVAGEEKVSEKEIMLGGEATLGEELRECRLAKEEVAITFAKEDVDDQKKFRDAQEYMQILENLTEGLNQLGLAEKQFPLFCKMESMRLILLRRMPLFGEYTVEEKNWRILGQAWDGLCQAAAVLGTAVDMEALNLDYMERSMHNFRELLGKRMELHGWSIDELGDGIYTDPKKSLTPILQGTAKPKPKKCEALQKRLGIYWKKYDPGFLTDDDAEYKKYARMARAYFSQGSFEEGKKLLEELEEKMDWGYLTNEQFAQYWEALFDWKNEEITEEEKNKEMWKILEYSGVKREKFADVGCSLTKTEWWALTEIAWSCEGEDLTFLCQVMKKQKEYLEETGTAGFFPEYYTKILYCLCHLERELKNLDEAERYANEGLGAMYEMNLYTHWGAFLFEKFRIVEDRKQGEMKEEDFEYIRQSYAVEKLFVKSKMGCESIEKYLHEHYKQDILADMKGAHCFILP